MAKPRICRCKLGIILIIAKESPRICTMRKVKARLQCSAVQPIKGLTRKLAGTSQLKSVE